MLRVKLFSVTAILFLCSGLCAAVSAAQECIDPAPGMIAWWPADGNSMDLQSGLHAVALNGASYAPGLVGEAFSFDGVGNGQDDRVELPPSALDGVSDVTIEMWVQTTDTSASMLSGASSPEQFTDNEVVLFQSESGMVGFMKQENTGVLPVSVNDGAWHHLAFTRAGGVGTLYVDGMVVDSRGYPAEPFVVGPGGLLLGQEQDCLAGCLDPNQAFDGLIDEVTFYDRALSDDEIVAIFDAGAAGKCKPPSMADLEQEIVVLEDQVDTLQARVDELEQELASQDDSGEECEDATEHDSRWHRHWGFHKRRHFGHGR